MPVLFYLLVMAPQVNAQCIANAGNDTILCHGLYGFDTIHIGGNPTAQFGTLPYTYSWERIHYVGSTNFYASLYLDDTTIANPKLISPSLVPLKFYLTVTDANGSVCKDSVLIRFSYFFIQLVDHYYYIQQGDSVKFEMGPVIQGNLNPLTYLWQPSLGLFDPTSLSTWAKPNVTTFYSLCATDSIGCSVTEGPFYYVYVSATGIQNLNYCHEFILTPNPVAKNSMLRLTNKSGKTIFIEFFDAQGRFVKRLTEAQNEQSVDISDLQTGTYYYRILNKTSVLTGGKLIIQ